jgi:hypothetical protein
MTYQMRRGDRVIPKEQKQDELFERAASGGAFRRLLIQRAALRALRDLWTNLANESPSMTNFQVTQEMGRSRKSMPQHLAQAKTKPSNRQVPNGSESVANRTDIGPIRCTLTGRDQAPATERPVALSSERQGVLGPRQMNSGTTPMRLSEAPLKQTDQEKLLGLRALGRKRH